jgi:hypothetical protein
MITPDDCLKKYGDPVREKSMVPWQVPTSLQKGKIPKRVYCNIDMVQPLYAAFENLIYRNKVDELRSWDGCFSIRKMRGSTKMSLHSWGVAIDVNAAENPLGAAPKLSPEFVRCFADAGFDWGGTWARPDGMHFQLSKI